MIASWHSDIADVFEWTASNTCTPENMRLWSLMLPSVGTTGYPEIEGSFADNTRTNIFCMSVYETESNSQCYK